MKAAAITPEQRAHLDAQFGAGYTERALATLACSSGAPGTCSCTDLEACACGPPKPGAAAVRTDAAERQARLDSFLHDRGTHPRFDVADARTRSPKLFEGRTDDWVAGYLASVADRVAIDLAKPAEAPRADAAPPTLETPARRRTTFVRAKRR
jgi:hypothetical protein